MLRIGLFIESSRASGRALLSGVADYSHRYGPWSFFWEPSGLEKLQPRLKSLDLDGIILRDVSSLEDALKLGIPTVVVGHQRAEIPGAVNIVTDSATVGRMAADHLMACGFKTFGYCGLRTSKIEQTAWSERRQEAFCARLAEFGHECSSHMISCDVSRSFETERKGLAKWLTGLKTPIGIMACNDDCGAEVMEACKIAGLSVPSEVGVIGADNDPVVCGLSNPPLSSVAINFEKAGYDAAQALHQLMRGEDAPSKIIVQALHVVSRRSTDVIAVDNPHLAKALRFIRDNAREALSVDDVAKAAGLSRRALEKHFRTRINRSILDEIRRVRTDYIARLLIETHFPVREIAEMAGFEDIQHFARYFSAVKKMSPLAYRKLHMAQAHAPTPSSKRI